jgi:hypothetical protein
MRHYGVLLCKGCFLCWVGFIYSDIVKAPSHCTNYLGDLSIYGLRSFNQNLQIGVRPTAKQRRKIIIGRWRPPICGDPSAAFIGSNEKPRSPLKLRRNVRDDRKVYVTVLNCTSDFNSDSFNRLLRTYFSGAPQLIVSLHRKPHKKIDLFAIYARAAEIDRTLFRVICFGSGLKAVMIGESSSVMVANSDPNFRRICICSQDLNAKWCPIRFEFLPIREMRRTEGVRVLGTTPPIKKLFWWGWGLIMSVFM